MSRRTILLVPRGCSQRTPCSCSASMSSRAAAASAEHAAELGAPADSLDAPGPQIALAATRFAAGGDAEALATLRRAGELGEAIDDASLVAWLAHVLAAAGQGEAARPMLARLLEQHRVAADVWSLQQELVALAISSCGRDNWQRRSRPRVRHCNSPTTSGACVPVAGACSRSHWWRRCSAARSTAGTRAAGARVWQRVPAGSSPVR